MDFLLSHREIQLIEQLIQLIEVLTGLITRLLI